jgi:hypothetical protein
MAQVVDTEVVLADSVLGTRTFGVRESRLQTEVVCNCDETQPHRKDKMGCGYGKSLQIALVMPTVPDQKK